MAQVSQQRQILQSLENLPTFATEAEEAAFWDSHELCDELIAHMGPLPEEILPPARPRAKAPAVRFDEDTLRRVKALARTRHTGYEALIRTFVAERLAEEEQREARRRSVPDRGNVGDAHPGRAWGLTTMITDEHESASRAGDAGERTFTLRDHVLAQFDHVQPEEREGVLAVAAAFARGEIEGTRLPGPEPYFRLQAAPDLLMFVERRPGAPVEVFDIMRPAALRTFANASAGG